MKYTYSIDKIKLHGMELFKVTVLLNGVEFNSSQHFSAEYSKTWALTACMKNKAQVIANANR